MHEGVGLSGVLKVGVGASAHRVVAVLKVGPIFRVVLFESG